MLLKIGPRYLSTPLGTAGNENRGKISKTIKIVQMANVIARRINKKVYLVLDAYFSVGTVINAAYELCANNNPIVHILTRAKKNVVAYRPAPKPKKKKRDEKIYIAQKIYRTKNS